MSDFQRMYSVSIVKPAPYAGIVEVPLRALRTREHVDKLVHDGWTVKAQIAEVVDLTRVPTIDELSRQIETAMLTETQRAILRGQLAKLRAKKEAR